MKIGTVYWITGLAGSGKTTLGKRLYEQLRLTNNAVVFLDGDNLREVFGHEQGHTLAERKHLAMKYSRLCQMLSEQGIDVVCATISLFKEIHEFNRQHLQKYCEIFVKCTMEEL
ncbi:MAG: adenylyl-sulfate kinase, partial [Thiotrichaceae bacterium IS1]